MKLWRICILFILVLSIGYGKEIDEKELVFRNGLAYEVNSTSEFTGTMTKTYKSGQLFSRKNYQNGQLEGIAKSYYPNGQLQSEVNYINGKLVSY